MISQLDLSAAQRQILAALEVPVWQSRAITTAEISLPEAQKVDQQVAAQRTPSDTAPESDAGASKSAVIEATSSGQSASISEGCYDQPTWQALQQQVTDCQACELHLHRQQVVFGGGSQTANWLIVGAAPGNAEQQARTAFAGSEGQLLENMLLALGLGSEQVYATNVVKCQPNQNREPSLSERQACKGHLRNQINLVKPKIILAMGRAAANSLLDTDQPVPALRGRDFVFDNLGIPVVVVDHPADLKSAQAKANSWEDLCFAQQRYNESLISE